MNRLFSTISYVAGMAVNNQKTGRRIEEIEFRVAGTYHQYQVIKGVGRFAFRPRFPKEKLDFEFTVLMEF